MAQFVVNVTDGSSLSATNISDGTTLAQIAVNPSRGPQGAGWTGVTYNTSTGRFVFTSNDGLGYESDDITVDLDAAVAAAEAAQAGAEAAEAATEALFDQFGDQYLGPKASDPTVDNDGNPLVEGAVYFNTTDDVLKFYSGTAWVSPESVATTAAAAAQAAQTAAETAEANAETAETNAASSASAAATSETNAAASASAAATSETNAATSETNAAASASAASTSETNAATSASAASTSETNAATSEANAASSASAASTSASNAATSEANAASSASAASASASAAATSEANAATSETNAAASYDLFDDRFLGAKASAPTLDNDGDALVTGALYFDTTLNEMRVYDGTQWLSTAYNSANVAVTGGTIDNTVIGGTTPAAISGTTGTFSGDLTVDTNTLHVDSTNNRVGVGTSSPSAVLHVNVGTETDNLSGLLLESTASGSTSSPDLTLYKNSSTPADDDFVGGLWFYGNNSAAESTAYGAILVQSTDVTDGSEDGAIVFSTTNTGSTGAEAMRIDRNGNLLVGYTASNVANAGISLRADNAAYFARSSATPLFVNRITDDGTLVNFRQNNNVEGTISVSGTTVSYNGGHLSRWSRLMDGADDSNIYKGTVMSNLNDMIVWGDEDNEQLNHTEVSSVEGDPNVAGVFVAWDESDEWGDYYLAMTGDMIIRIASGVTVQRGDLLMSAGDGTAKPQEDDLVRSKTVAKVISTEISCTYADGSYCVPCVLMGC